MSNLADLKLREVIDASYTTKGETLTFAEVDNNFILLANVIKENIVEVNPGGINAYVGETEYSNGDFVTYGGNLWEYTNPTPSTGNVPATGSTYWTLQSSGTLTHAQNTDTHTTSPSFGIGSGGITKVYARNTGAPAGLEPQIVWVNVDGERVWKFSNNGVDFFTIGSGSAVWGAITGNIEDQTDIVQQVQKHTYLSAI